MPRKQNTPTKNAAVKPPVENNAKPGQRVNVYAGQVTIDNGTHLGVTDTKTYHGVGKKVVAANQPVDLKEVGESLLATVNEKHGLELSLADSKVSVSFALVDTYITE